MILQHLSKLNRLEQIFRRQLLLAAAEVPVAKAKTLVAVAGTATTVTAAALVLAQYDRYAIHLARISAATSP